MALRLHSIFLPFFAFLALTAAALQPSFSETPAQKPRPVDTKKVSDRDSLLPAIRACLYKNTEALLTDSHVYCMRYREAHEFLILDDGNAPLPRRDKFDRFCPDHPGAIKTPPFSARVLTSEMLQNLLFNDRSRVGPYGVRIFNAVFCDPLKLVGLELSSSLVLDHSLFRNGIEIRNLYIRGDLSFDSSFIFDHLKIFRSDIKGSLYGDTAFISRLEVTNSVIDGSVSFNQSVLLHSTQFDNVAITRELNIRASALSYLLIQLSKINGLLDLSHSEALCAYHINKSEIGFLVAKRAGFGAIELLPKNASTKPPYRYIWKRHNSVSVKSILESAEIQNLVKPLKAHFRQRHSFFRRNYENGLCENEFNRTYISEFFIFDSKINSSLCIAEFKWLSLPNTPLSDIKAFFKKVKPNRNYRPDDYIRTTIAVSGNNIGNNFIIDLWPSQTKDQSDNDLNNLHVFEAIGIKAAALVIDFKDSNRPYSTLLDGLEFNRVHNTHAVCEYGGNENNNPPKGKRKHLIISDFNDQLKLPTIENVLEWLELNKSGSTQPYTAFAKSFEAAGMDSTRIKVARANRELCERATNWFTSFINETCRKFISPKSQNERRQGLTDAENTASANLCDRANDWFLAHIANSCPDVARRYGKNNSGLANNVRALIPKASASTDTNLNMTKSSPILPGASKEAGKSTKHPATPFETLSDFALLMFRSGLWAIADHGYRPGKVLWWVTVTLILYWLFFLVGLRVVLFLPKPSQASSKETSTTSSGEPTTAEANPNIRTPSIPSTDSLKKINLLFLFDRLIPSYKISEKNYDIVKYFKWISKSEADKIGQGALRHKGYIYHYVREVNETECRRIEKSLLVLRLLGIIYTIFLAAAVSALIVH